MVDNTDTDTTSSTGKHSSSDAAATADGDVEVGVDVVMGNVSKANTDTNTDTETEDNESDTMEMNPSATTQEADKENQDELQKQSSTHCQKPIIKITADPLPVPLDLSQLHDPNLIHLQPAGVEEEDMNNNDVGVTGKEEELKKNNYPTSLTIDTNDDDDDEPRVNNYSGSGGVAKLKMESSELNGGRVTEAGLVGMDQPLVGNKLLMDVVNEGELKTPAKSFLLEPNASEAEEPGTDEEQAAFMKELEVFHKENYLEFKPPKFYGEPLNCLKLWRSVIRLGGYEQVTSCKLWRQVGESFKPPKTCTTVSWTFRCFYEKALLEYEKYKMRIGELPFTDAFTEPAPLGHQTSLTLASGSGRARRDAAARAMQGWHSQRLLGNGEVGDPIIKDKNSSSVLKREKQFMSIGILKRKKPSSVERAVKVARMKASKAQLNSMVVDIGLPADWVKINVQKIKDCFEVYALVPGLLREEVRVQSDPAGRLVITGQPEQLDNPWGVTPFKKVVSLPSRIDPQTTSAVVTLHGQLFVRVPFEQPD